MARLGARGLAPLEPTNPLTPASQGYGYDAFGNLTSVGNVNTPTDVGTNLLIGAAYAAGNMASWNGQSYAFDALNQMIRFCAGTCLWRIFSAGSSASRKSYRWPHERLS